MGSDYRCTVCWIPATSLCGRCELVRYCGPGCQKYDWEKHKVFCGADAYPAKNQTAKSYRALFFPVDEEKPRFIEVSFESRCGSQQESEATVPTVEALLDNRGTRTLTRAGAVQNRDRELVNGQLVLHLRPTMYREEVTPNVSLRKFMGLGVENDLRGPIVISKKRENGGTDAEEEHMDMEMDDLSDAGEFLRFQMLSDASQKKISSNFNLLDILGSRS